MTKAELLELLKDVPMDGVIVTAGTMNGFNDATNLIHMYLLKNEFSWGNDEYEYLGQNEASSLMDYGDGKPNPKFIVKGYSIG